MTIDTQTLLAELDALTDKVQGMATNLARSLTAGELPHTRELYEAHELLHSGAAHLRGAAAQVARHIGDVTPVTDTLLADRKEEK